MLPRATPTPLDDAPPSGDVAFVTDFGTTDTYAAQMVGALLTANPRARVVAQHHAVPPQDVTAGAEALGELAAAFPPGTTFVAVVDPGVGTDRAVLAARAGGRFFVAPDNGLLSATLAADPAAEAVRLDQSAARSRTFHGRDLMAPAAGRLTRGTPLRMLGEPTATWVSLDVTPPRRRPDGAVVGRVVRADRFGNLLIDVSARLCPDAASATLAGRTVPAAGTYADVPAGAPLALIGSNGRWEIAVRDGNAAAALGVGPSESVLFTPKS